MRRTIKTDRLHGQPPGAIAVEFDMLEGVPFRADVVRPYNSYGSAVRKLGPVTPDMADRIGEWLFHLQDLSGKRAAAIVTCSVWRRHPPGSTSAVSSHTEGQGIDVGGVWWSPTDGITAWDYGQRRREAIAVEATLRLHFGTVLGPSSNVRHADHWHADMRRPPAVTWAELQQSRRGARKVEVVWIQEACRYVHGLDLGVDGQWGPQTDRAVGRVLDALSCESGDIREPATYLAFNTATALVGFGQVERVTEGG